MDNNKTKSFLTFKSGKFVFSSNYSTEKTNEMLFKTGMLYQTVAELPILPKFREKLDKDLIIKSIFSTAAMEGNPLSEQKVGEIVGHPKSIKTQETAEKEIANLESAYTLITALAETSTAVTEDIINKIHAEVTRSIEHTYNIPGQYRNEKVYVGDDAHGGVYTPPVINEDIKNVMKIFVEWIESPEITQLGPVIKAALAHYHLGLIHPFSDGNGRTARLLEALILKSAHMKYIPTMLSNYYYQNIDEYYRVFVSAEKSDTNDITSFIEFVLKGHNTCLMDLKGSIVFFIRRLALADYYRYSRKEKTITQRQYELMELLLNNSVAFTLSDLLTVSPFSLLYKGSSERTARRDLIKLTSLAMLLREGDGRYRLNIHRLD